MSWWGSPRGRGLDTSDLSLYIGDTLYSPTLDDSTPIASSFCDASESNLDRLFDPASSGCAVFVVSGSSDAVEGVRSRFRAMSSSSRLLATSSRSATVSIAERSGEPCNGCAKTREMLVAGCAEGLSHFGLRLESKDRMLEGRRRIEEEDMGVGAMQVAYGGAYWSSCPY